MAISLGLLLGGCASHKEITPRSYDALLGTPVAMGLNTPFNRPISMYHIVGPQETLWRISKSYGVPIETLMDVNKIQDPEQISNGQRLLIPNTYGPRPVIPLYSSRKWEYIVVHHTASDWGNAFEIDQMHHDRGFWNGMGYHFLIDNGTNGKLQGQIEIGPRWVKQMDGAHANKNGMNKKGIGIGLVGNFSETTVPDSQLESLVYLVKILQDYYGIPSSKVIGHRDVPGASTECPGKIFPWNKFKRRL